MARTKSNKGHGYNKYRLHYDAAFKWRVCQEYLQGNETKAAVQRRNGVKGRTNIVVWLRQFGLNDKPKTLSQHEQLSLKMPKPSPITTDEQRIKTLEKELAEAKLRADAYQMMVEIAEKTFKIDIRKKYATKQSTPLKQQNPM